MGDSHLRRLTPDHIGREGPGASKPPPPGPGPRGHVGMQSSSQRIVASTVTPNRVPEKWRGCDTPRCRHCAHTDRRLGGAPRTPQLPCNVASPACRQNLPRWPVIHCSTPEMCNEHLPCARPWTRHWSSGGEQDIRQLLS